MSDRRLVFAIPGDIETRSGGYGYDRRMIAELRSLGWTVDHVPLPPGFPFPNEAERGEAQRLMALLEAGSLVLVDGLAFGAMPQIVEAHAGRLRLVALVHHPLALETGLSAARSAILKASETAALRFARGIVVTSPMTARTLVSDFGVGSETPLLVAIPGTEQAPAARGSGAGPMTILSVGSLTARKDHATLVAALASLADQDWQCRIVGSATLDRPSADALREQIERAGLEERIVLVGAIGGVAPEYDRADIFALASHYEGYGMAFAEAMVRGLPVVACRGGAVPDLVPEGAGALVEPGNVRGFADALASLLDDPGRRRQCAAVALDAGRRLPDWPTSAGALSDFLQDLR